MLALRIDRKHSVGEGVVNSGEETPVQLPREGVFARRRVRLEGVEHRSFPDSSYRCTVALTWRDSRRVEGSGQEADTQQGRLRAAAEACLRAQEEATEGRLRLELGGVKAVRAFDAWVVIAQVRAVGEDQSYRLIGSVDIPGDHVAQGAVLAALDATNRILERYLPSADTSGSDAEG